MREERNLNAAQSEEVANVSGRHTGKNLAKATKVLQFISSSFHQNTAVMLNSVQKRMGFCFAFFCFWRIFSSS